MRLNWNNLSKLFLHFWFPRTCFGCGRDLPWQSEAPLCAECEAGLQPPGPLVCKRCGAVLKSGGGHCYRCRGSKAQKYKCRVIRSACQFNAASRELVHALKYAQADYLASYMGNWMARSYVRYPELAEAEVVVPVPLFPKKNRRRGYNQSALLAQVFAPAVGLAYTAAVLVRVRDTVSQTKLGRQARLENMTGAFRCINPSLVKGKTVLLIDDVATTGATLEGCAVSLKEAGAKKVLAYTFARE